MVKNMSEIPVTYLNKGKAYNLSVIDLSPPIVSHEHLEIDPHIPQLIICRPADGLLLYRGLPSIVANMSQ
jgi:hypothetical protein